MNNFVFCKIVPISYFQNKTAFAKISKALLVVQPNGCSSRVTFLALWCQQCWPPSPESPLQGSPAPLHSDFLLDLWTPPSVSSWPFFVHSVAEWPLLVPTQQFSPLASFWWNPDVGPASSFGWQCISQESSPVLWGESWLVKPLVLRVWSKIHSIGLV